EALTTYCASPAAVIRLLKSASEYKPVPATTILPSAGMNSASALYFSLRLQHVIAHAQIERQRRADFEIILHKGRVVRHQVIRPGRVQLTTVAVYPAQQEIRDRIAGEAPQEIQASARVAVAAREILHPQKIAAELERMLAANPGQRAGVLIVVEGPNFRDVIGRA